MNFIRIVPLRIIWSIFSFLLPKRCNSNLAGHEGQSQCEELNNNRDILQASWYDQPIPFLRRGQSQLQHRIHLCVGPPYFFVMRSVIISSQSTPSTNNRQRAAKLTITRVTNSARPLWIHNIYPSTSLFNQHSTFPSPFQPTHETHNSPGLTTNRFLPPAPPSLLSSLPPPPPLLSSPRSSSLRSLSRPR